MQESFRTKPHGGIDLGVPAGVFISLTADAEVVASGSYGAYGYLIGSLGSISRSSTEIRT